MSFQKLTPRGLLTHSSACIQQAGTVQGEVGCCHRGIGEHRLSHSYGWIGVDRAWLDHTDRCHHHGGCQQQAGVLVVRQVNSLAKAGSWGLTGGEVVVHSQQALSKALPPAKKGPPHLVSTLLHGSTSLQKDSRAAFGTMTSMVVEGGS